MSLRVEIQEHRCVAAGQCVLVAPEVFDQRDDDGVVILLEETPGDEDQEAVRNAAAVCPAAAIAVS